MLSFAVVFLFGAFVSAASGLTVDVLMQQRVISPCPTLFIPLRKCPIDITTITLTIPPGDIGDTPHYHPGPAAGYILEGEFLIQVKGQPHRIVPAGSTFYENFGDIHLWGANGSNSTTCRAVVTVFGQPGKDLVTHVKDTRTENWAQAVDMAKRGV